MENLILVKKKNELVKELLEKISKEKDISKSLDLYKEILDINNTDREIVLKYLLLHKKKNEKEKVKSIEEYKKYINHFPPQEWNTYFSEIIKKENSSIEKLELILKKILTITFEMTKKEKAEIIRFFKLYINETKIEINNTSPITWENDELYIYFLFQTFMSRLESKMNFYSEESHFFEIENKDYINAKENIKKIEDDLREKHTLQYIKELNDILERQKNNLYSIILFEGKFFKSYLKQFSLYLKVIKETFLKDISKKKFDKKEDKYTFEYFMFFISNYDFENITKEINHVWKHSFKILNSDKKNKIYENFKMKEKVKEFSIDKGTLTIIFPESEKIEIENIDDYDIKSLFKHLNDTDEYNKNECMKFIKIPKINNNLFIQKIKNEWITFNFSIFNSKTIKTLFASIIKEQDDSLLNEGELNTIFDNIMYFTFPTDFKGLTERKIMKIYEYGLLEDIKNEDISKLISFAFLLNINEHEILGHYNIGYQTYNCSKKKEIYYSPKVDKTLSTDYAKNRGDKESGENIEIKLYGRVIKSFTIKEALFVLNLNNYFCDYNTFRKNFMKCNNEKVKIDIVFQTVLERVFRIKIEKIKLNENECFPIDNFIKKYTHKDTYSIKGKHPMWYNIDGIYEDKSKYIEQLIEAYLNLDKSLDLSNEPYFNSKIVGK